MEENQITGSIVDASLKVHVALGPGLLESVYETVLSSELRNRGLTVERQKAIPIIYEGKQLDEAFRADIFVGEKVLVELKSVEALQPIHSKQLLTYLRLSGLRVGLLINFNVVFIREGIKRIANNAPD